MKRTRFIEAIDFQFKVHPVCALLGPRQVGKTTLAETYVERYLPGKKVRFFDLENPLDLAQLENPVLALTDTPYDLIVIDEIQRRPDLFPVLRYIIDTSKRSIKFLILGSASRDLLRQSSETLAGRIGLIELPPFSLAEVHDAKKLWIRGGFPLSYLAEADEISFSWRENYIATFLERDIPMLGFDIPPAQLRRFWMMLAHYHGQIFNASEIGKSLGVSHHTARKYLDLLIGTYMIRELLPWFENISKRQVKSSKIYFRDSGILNALVNIHDEMELRTFSRLGAFWEGFALEEIIRCFEFNSKDCYFWSTQADAELDLFTIQGGKRLGFEIKYSDAPKITKSMRIAMEDLKLDKLSIFIPGKATFRLDEKIFVYGIEQLESPEFTKNFMV